MKKRFLTFALIFFSIFLIPGRVNASLTTFSDYTFVSDTRITAHSWTFDLVVKDSVYKTPSDGIVLSYHYYNTSDYDPVNYISPVDIVIASGAVARNPSFYDFDFSWGDRYVNVSFYAPPGEAESVISCLGNTHCIARNNETLAMIENVVNGSAIQLEGYLVDIYGWNLTTVMRWKTDTQFGNEECEILVISSIVPSVPTVYDVYVMVLILVAAAASAGIIILMHSRERKACLISNGNVKKISKNM